MANQVTSSTDTATQVLERDDFSALLSKEFKPKTDQAREAVVAAVRTLAEQALAQGAGRPRTLVIKQGTLLNVYVTEDIDFNDVLGASTVN